METKYKFTGYFLDTFLNSRGVAIYEDTNSYLVRVEYINKDSNKLSSNTNAGYVTKTYFKKFLESSITDRIISDFVLEENEVYNNTARSLNNVFVGLSPVDY